MNYKLLFLGLLLLLFTSQAFAISDTNLIAYWKVDSDGTSVIGDFNLTPSPGAVSYSAGKIGNALNSDGTNYLYKNTSILTNGDAPFTISMWLKPSNTAITTYPFYDADAIKIGFKANKYSIGIRNANPTWTDIASTATPNTNWTHLVVVWEGKTAQTIRFYVNGTTAGTGTYNSTISTSATNGIGLGGTYYDSTYQGQLDEASAWARVLSPTEINDLYNAGTGLTYPFVNEYIDVDYNYVVRKDLNKIILTDTSTTLGVTKTNFVWTSNGTTISTAQDYNLTATELTDYNICLHVDTNVSDVNGDKCYSFNTGDWTPPTTTFSSFQVPNTTDQNITLTCTDNNSGCKAINYKIDGNANWTTLNNPNNIDSNYFITTEYKNNEVGTYKEYYKYCFDKNTYANNSLNYYLKSIKNQTKRGSNQQGKVKYLLYFADGSTEYSNEIVLGGVASTYAPYTLTITSTNKDINCVGLWLYHSGNSPGTFVKDQNFIYTKFSTGIKSSFLYSGAGSHSIQYYSTDNSDNNETTNFSYFPQFQTTQDQPNSRMIFTGTTIYNDYNVTSWQWTVNGTPLTGTTDKIKYYSTQANLDLNVCLTTNSTDTTCQSSKTWDTINPTIDANITPNTYGFVTNFDLNYNMICYDNFSPIRYTIQANNGTLTTLYDSSDANATLKTGHYDINVGQKAQLIFTCTDDSNNTATYTSIYLYALQFRLINENTGTLFDLNKVTDAKAYSYDGNFIYSFKDANLTSKNFFSPSTTIRFDFTYPDTDATKLSREINFDYVEDENVGICVAEYQQFYLYRFLSTSVKPVVLYNDYANCYNLASTTKFLYNTYQSNSAYTINKPYYLYTYTNGIKSLLALLDGANNTEINLDILAFNQQEYVYSVNTDVLVFAPTTDGNTIKFYFNSPNQNDSVSLNIYNGNTLLWNYTELVDTNAFEINFFYGDLNITDTNLMRVVVTVVLDGETSTFYKYFNTKAEVYSGLLNPIVAIVFSFLIMFFGITMVSYRFALGWFGLAVSLLAIGILALAPLYDYIIFLQAIYFIIGLFIGVVGKEQNLGVQ